MLRTDTRVGSKDAVKDFQGKVKERHFPRFERHKVPHCPKHLCRMRARQERLPVVHLVENLPATRTAYYCPLRNCHCVSLGETRQDMGENLVRPNYLGDWWGR